ncbi:MAG: PP2C family protein-serine/threonine phosphatase, partial [Candidatus Gracilibacteria bacterium]
GGDLFNFITIKDKTYAYIGDVTGHGAAAGVIMFMVNVLITVFSETCKNSYEILVNVNKHLKKYVKKSMYMTLVMISFDSKTKKFSYTGAGHEHILVYRAATGQCEAIISGGIALGMLADNSKIIKEKEIELENGDFIALYSDGITECRNDKDELFGLERLKASLSEHGQTYDALGVHFHVAKDVSEFMKNQPQLDDMTLIILKRDDNLVVDNKESAKTIKW